MDRIDKLRRTMLALAAGAPLTAACQTADKARGARDGNGLGRDQASVADFGATGDGKRDDTAAVQAAFDSGAARIYIPAGKYRVTDTLVVPDDLLIEGASRARSQIVLAETAPEGVDVLRVGQQVTLRNFWIRGNWDRRSKGRRGNGIIAWDRKSGFIHGLTLESMQIDRCKQHGIHIVDGAYNRIWNLDCNTHGSDAVFLEGMSTASSTTTEIGGVSILSSCSGFAIRIKNCANCKFSFVSEYTMGVGIEGNNRALSFDGCYFETPFSADQEYIFDFMSGGSIGVTIKDCYLGMSVKKYVLQFDKYVKSMVLFNNVNLSGRPYCPAEMNGSVVKLGNS
ncbi:MAG: glycosyl hydrolase family 28-related protein [Sphingomonas sp.]